MIATKSVSDLQGRPAGQIKPTEHGKGYMKNQMRKITIGEHVYLWTVTTKTRQPPETRISLAEATFSAFHQTNKHNPLRILVTTWDDAIAGNPLKTGWRVKKLSGEEVLLNINHPRIARQLIEYAHAHGWEPEKNNVPHSITDGMNVLAELGYNINELLPRS
jgi:hypothetical protein